MNIKKISLAILLSVFVALFFGLDLGQYLTLEYIKSQQAQFDELYAQNPGLVIALYFVIYVAVTGLSLPGATLITLVGGALFGVVVGTIVVSFASTIGATVAFIVSRYLLKDFVQHRFANHLEAINRGIEKDGIFYLFTLRLVPIFPFFVINLVMGLTPIKLFQFFWVSQVGMFLGTVVYVNAGTQLSQIDSLAGIMSFELLLSFALLGIFPLLAKKIAAWFAAKKVYRGFDKPRQFDQNLVVIGAGAAGLVTSYIAATVKAKVVLIEKNKMGGDCLNTGCVPSKALIRSTKIINYIGRSQEFGLKTMSAEFEFKEIMARIKGVIKKIEPHDSVERYQQLGVQCINGEAKIKSPFIVEVDGKELSSRNIVIATGAKPFTPPIPGLLQVGFLNSDNLWELRSLPQRMVVMGGGPIGCELSQAFARLGVKIIQLEMLPRILHREDEEVSDFVAQKLQQDGVEVLTGHKVISVKMENNEKVLCCEFNNKAVNISCDEILVAVGRVANATGLGLENIDLAVNQNGSIAVNEFMQTNYPNILACGDVAGPYQFTHMAAHQAWYASVNALFGGVKKFKVDYSVVPWCTFTDPEVARVGLNELEAKTKGIPYELTRYDIDDLDRAIADGENRGFIKILTVPGKDKILGVTLVGYHAGDLIAEYVLAMKHGLGLNKILATPHIYPTLMESNKYVAGEWKKAHAPENLLRWVERYHSWKRR